MTGRRLNPATKKAAAVTAAINVVFRMVCGGKIRVSDLGDLGFGGGIRIWKGWDLGVLGFGRRNLKRETDDDLRRGDLNGGDENGGRKESEENGDEIDGRW